MFYTEISEVELFAYMALFLLPIAYISIVTYSCLNTAGRNSNGKKRRNIFLYLVFGFIVNITASTIFNDSSGTFEEMISINERLILRGQVDLDDARANKNSDLLINSYFHGCNQFYEKTEFTPTKQYYCIKAEIFNALKKVKDLEHDQNIIDIFHYYMLVFSSMCLAICGGVLVNLSTNSDKKEDGQLIKKVDRMLEAITSLESNLSSSNDSKKIRDSQKIVIYLTFAMIACAVSLISIACIVFA